MSIWDRLNDPFGTLGKVNDIGTDVFHKGTGIPTAQEKRGAMNAVNEQVKAYKEQTELTRKELNDKRNEVAAEKRRVEEKQIRALRRNRGMQGFLGTGQTDQAGMSEKLGG